MGLVSLLSFYVVMCCSRKHDDLCSGVVSAKERLTPVSSFPSRFQPAVTNRTMPEGSRRGSQKSPSTTGNGGVGEEDNAFKFSDTFYQHLPTLVGDSQTLW